ncbi:MAG: hypothetical protein JWM96_342 [Alphaproteobacteria bacterium]|nr:hypothetical protein [Alphaproteobacteria bacterium]
MVKPSNFKYYFLLLVPCLLYACVSVPLTEKDKKSLYELRQMLSQKDFKEPNFLFSLVEGNPVHLASEAAKKEDYRLIALGMGYHATEKDASVVGLSCAGPVKTQNLVFGCIPPPVVTFKLMAQYNLALRQQPGFPKEAQCTVDTKMLNDFKKMDW